MLFKCSMYILNTDIIHKTSLWIIKRNKKRTIQSIIVLLETKKTKTGNQNSRQIYHDRRWWDDKEKYIQQKRLITVKAANNTHCNSFASSGIFVMYYMTK